MEIVFSETKLTSGTPMSEKRQKKLFRMDKRGFPILKGSKMHSVTFKDQAAKGELQQVVFVECWKQINFEQKHSTKGNQCCALF